MSTATDIYVGARFKDFVSPPGLGSPIEEEFYRVISKYLSPSVELCNQYPAKVQGYNFAIDFVIRHGEERIGIECDGKEYHNFEKDEWRDKQILNAGILHSIVRFRGSDINFRLPDALFAMAQWYPDIFSQRGLDNIETLATLTARSTSIWESSAHYWYHPPEEVDIDNPIDDKYAEGFGELHLYRKRKGDR